LASQGVAGRSMQRKEVAQNEYESFYSTDNSSNFLTIDSIVDQKVYGRFAFNAQSESNVLKITEGTFKEVPIW